MEMGFYNKYLLPKLTDFACGLSVITAERARLAPLAAGEVLEIGIGSGLNLPLYDARKVHRVVGIDPCAALLALTRKRSARLPFPVELMATGADPLGLPSNRFDTAVVTFTLCSIADAGAALREVRRVLKPDGRLLFLEHGAAPDAGVRRWQRRLTPLWKSLAGGCHLDREMPALIAEAGFVVGPMECGYLSHAPRFAGYCFRGIATPA
jgi:SAM-dependent methyltransferase